MNQTKPRQPVSKLRVVALGGVDEIGKNMYVFEYEDDIVVVDCGSIFPKEDMLGVDLVLPRQQAKERPRLPAHPRP